MAREWKETTLGEMVNLKRGYDLPIQNREPGPYPVVSSSGITGRHREAKVKGPGVATGRYGTLGEVHYVDEDFWPLNTTLYVEDFKGNDPKFISYLLKSLDFQAYSDKSSVPGLNRNHLHTEPVHVPIDLGVQRSIANILGSLDDKIELNQRMNKLLEAMARAVFKAWFADFEPVKAKAAGAPTFRGMPQQIFDQLPEQFSESELGLIPTGWHVEPLSKFLELLGGGTPKRKVPEFWKGAIPWFSVRDAPSEGDVWVIDTDEHITQAGVDNSSANVMRAGTTIISARGTVGRLALTAVPMAINQSCYGAQGVAGVPDFFVYFTLRQAVEELQQRTHGSVFDTITRDTFDVLSRIRPQPQILVAFDDAIAPYLHLIRNNLFESRTLACIRDALLPKLISGTIPAPDIKGADDGR